MEILLPLGHAPTMSRHARVDPDSNALSQRALCVHRSSQKGKDFESVSQPENCRPIHGALNVGAWVDIVLVLESTHTSGLETMYTPP